MPCLVPGRVLRRARAATPNPHPHTHARRAPLGDVSNTTGARNAAGAQQADGKAGLGKQDKVGGQGRVFLSAVLFPAPGLAGFPPARAPGAGD